MKVRRARINKAGRMVVGFKIRKKGYLLENDNNLRRIWKEGIVA